MRISPSFFAKIKNLPENFIISSKRKEYYDKKDIITMTLKKLKQLCDLVDIKEKIRGISSVKYKSNIDRNKAPRTIKMQTR